MPSQMPYRATTATGDVLDFRFPLHPETGSPMRVNQLVSQLLATLDRELKLLGEVGNGDVLQAVAMTLAVRAAMIHAPREQTAQLAFELARRALEAGVEAERSGPVSGRA